MCRRRWLAAVLLLMLATTTGCWDQLPLEHVNVFFGLGFDRAGGESSLLRMTTHGPLFEREAKQPMHLLTAEGKTVADALRRIQRRSNNRAVLGKVKVVVFGEELSRQGLEEVLHALDHNFQFNSTALLAVAVGRAEEIFSFIPVPTPRTALYIEELLTSVEERITALPMVRYEAFMARLESHDKNGYMPLLAITESGKMMEPVGLAVFRHDKMVGTYTMEETAGVMMLTGELEDKDFTILKEKPTPGYITVRMIGSRRTFRVKKLGRVPEIEITFTSKSCYLVEHVSSDKVFKEETIRGAERALNQTVTELANAVVKKQQGYGSDIFNLGEYLHAYYPQYMATVDWEDVFPRAKITVRTDIRIDRIGTSQ